MRIQHFILPVLIFSIILGFGTYTIALLYAFHLDINWELWSFYTLGWFLFFLIQMIAPMMRRIPASDNVSSRIRKELVWFGYLAMGVHSTFFTISVIAEIFFHLLLSFEVFGVESLHRAWLFGVTSVSAGLIVLGMYQALLGPWVKHVEIPLERLPQEFHGFRILQISDLHVSALIGRRYVNRVVRLSNRETPDLIVLTGDFVDGHVDDLREDFSHLSGLISKDGSYFITGNHEYYHDGSAWVAEHERMGHNVLLNTHAKIRRGDSEIALIGLPDRTAGSFVKSHAPNMDQAMQGLDSEIVKILLAHQPGCYEEASQRGVDLQLSGHTHGGQFFPWQYVVKLVHRYSKGLARHGNMWIYVNQGTGFWGPPVRATIPPEITVLTLTKKLISDT